MTPFVDDQDFTLYVGDVARVLRHLPRDSVDCVVTSPPYLDARPEYPSPSREEWRAIFDELRRVVRGPALFNVGRIWRGHRELLWWVDLLRIADSRGWALLDTLVWIKPNGNPIQGRVALADAHEYVFMLGEPGATAFNVDAVRTPYTPASIARMERPFRSNAGVKGKDRPLHRRDPVHLHPGGARPKSYVEILVGREKGNLHPAPMPLDLAEHMVKLASWPGQTVLDPFCGSGTTALAARRQGRLSIGVELLEEFAVMGAARLSQQELLAA